MLDALDERKRHARINNMILMLDNYDSFTFNLVQYLRELHSSVCVLRNDEVTIDDIYALNPEKIIISPGPGRPENAGITLAVIREFATKIPILGVCLGHQSIAQYFGAKIIHARNVMHGKTSLIYHNEQGIFCDLPNPFRATRYHSLVIDPDTLSQNFIITAYTKNTTDEMDEIMGIKHKTQAMEGVQFHPESILTEHGHQLLNNFLVPSLLPQD